MARTAEEGCKKTTDAYFADEIFAKALSKAQEIAKWPVSALKATKRCLKSSHIKPMRSAFQIELDNLSGLVESAEYKEAFAAVRVRRKPRIHP